MVRDIIHDEFFLRQTSAPATRDDLPAAQDLRGTLAAHRGECVGLAANMIGVLRRIIAVEWEGGCLLMLNPEILRASGVYQTEEGCLSLTGTRQTKRYRSIKVRYQTEAMETRIRTFTDLTAEIIQHEIDHCNGILI